MQSLAEAVRYLYSLGNEVKTIKLGLERIQILLTALGHPERACPVVHIAGTNGKGSVSAMVESTLRHAGFRTGLYTSPHLVTPQERIRVNGENICEGDFLAAFAAVHKAAESLVAEGRIDMHPTYFETITAMGFWHFREAQVERLVLEVGLGGRLDATNVVDPLLSIITPIDYDHQQYLGNTLIAIGREKAGIIKPGRPVVLSPQPAEARPAFPVDVVDVNQWSVEDLQETPEGCTYSARCNPTALAIDCPLPGPHQVVNSLTAAVALHTLGLDPEAIQRGIAATRWPGRLEVIRRSPLTYLDGAHNPGAARSLHQFIQKHFQSKLIWMVFGVMRDKDVPAIAGELFPLAHRLILTRANQDRSLEPEAIAALHPHPSLAITQSVPEALDQLASAPPDTVIFITGSLFVVGEARPLFQ